MARASQRRRRSDAARASKHDLYEQSVQEPDGEIEFVDRVFRRRRGRVPLSLREDFCGTALFCARWVQGRPGRSAVGVDLDRETLDWGRKHRLEPIGQAAERVQLLCANVLDVEAPAVDVITAFNFSYCLIHERRDLLRYCRRAREQLAAEGLFVLDFHAGPRSQEEIEEETEHDDFTYLWQQGEIDALSGRARRAIHFRFPDGSQLRNAFSYEFRVWTLPELRDLLDEAGFAPVDVYFEDFDDEGYTTGSTRKVKRMAHEDSWVGYLVAEPGQRRAGCAQE